MTRIRVVNTFPLDEQHRAALASASPRLEIEHREMPDQASIDQLEDEEVEVLFADSAPTDLTRTPRLRWLQYSGAGVDALAVDAPWERGLLVTSASGTHAVYMAEYAIGAMLIASHRWRERAEHQRLHEWSTNARREALIAQSLEGRTVAIIGYGSIGREVARLANAFGMRVVAVKARPEALADDGWTLPGRGDPEGTIPERVYGLDGIGSAVSEADFVVVAAPLTSGSRAIVGAQILRSIRPDAWLVNVGRGSLFDEDELIEALRTGRLAGATLDVTAVEPLPSDSPLWTLPNVMLTPHVSGAGVGLWDRLTDLFVENLRRYANGEPLLNLVRREGY
jgi:phosphoglycerate dehydrogenase-like enzyme